MFTSMPGSASPTCRAPLLLLALVVLFLAAPPPIEAAQCADTGAAALSPEPVISGWGYDEKNLRFIAPSRAAITPGNLPRLTLQWVFALPETKAARAVPLITSNAVVIADEDGSVYALDRATGCEHWRFDAGAMVRTALRHIAHKGKDLLVFGTFAGELISLDLSTGKELWRSQLADHAYAMLSGSAVDHEGVIYQPVSSYELFVSVNPFYGCCTFRGALVAVSADDGRILWRTHTIEQTPGVTHKRLLLPDQRGPSGAPVWSQPTLDIERQRVYVGTGENYSNPATDTSDAIIAFDMHTGQRLWVRQFLQDDVWNLAWLSDLHPNCPDNPGEDLDFGAPPILASVGGRDYLLAGQKNAQVYALDPAADGKLLWTARAGSGGKAGGIHFAMAVDEQRGVLYVPVSDRPLGKWIGDSFNGTPNPSLQAYDITTGEQLWSTAAPGRCLDARQREIDGCHPGFSAAPTASGDLVYAPTLDGVIRVFDAANGKQLWSFDTYGEFPAVNDATAQGGAIDVGGVQVAGGQLFVLSGYGQFGQMPGNAFMVFAVAPPSASEQAGPGER